MNTTTVLVYTVYVPARDDAIYVFANEDDAERFCHVLMREGTDSVMERQTVCHRGETDALIASELDE